MAKFTIEIEDTEIKKEMERRIADIATDFCEDDLRKKCGNYGKEIRDSVRDIVYSHKEEIIEKCVERATVELVKRGFPILVDRFRENENHS